MTINSISLISYIGYEDWSLTMFKPQYSTKVMAPLLTPWSIDYEVIMLAHLTFPSPPNVHLNNKKNNNSEIYLSYNILDKFYHYKVSVPPFYACVCTFLKLNKGNRTSWTSQAT
jgi:hypothetical protein